MAVTCLRCDKPIQGEAFVHADGVMHRACVEPYQHAKSGRPHRCPKCKGTKVADHPTHTKSVSVSLRAGEIPECGYNGCMGCAQCRNGTRLETVPVKVKCDLCEGHGYTKTKAEPRRVTTTVGWDL